MIIRILLSTLVAATAIPAVAAEESFVVEPVHSQPTFETRHIGMSPQHGNFGKVSGKVTLDRAEKKGTVDITIDATSIRTFDTRLDAIVKGERFFNDGMHTGGMTLVDTKALPSGVIVLRYQPTK